MKAKKAAKRRFERESWYRRNRRTIHVALWVLAAMAVVTAAHYLH